MELVRCPEHNGLVPLVNPRGWQGAPTLVGRLEIARHAVGPLVEIAPGYWRRLPCFGSRKIIKRLRPDPDPPAELLVERVDPTQVGRGSS